MSGHEFDQAAFDELLAIFDEERIEAFIANLRQLSIELTLGDVTAVDDIEMRAHKLASRAGILGCSRLSELSLVLEQACRDRRDLRAPLSAVEDEAERTSLYFDARMVDRRKRMAR
ncbi:Hpt domain-containing protein [Notoacmeibacter marinus]|uniref:Hpt domain-containing protein n=1 Tax=Notoacmeibacter marinus TaxID=1876515 RepID=UPI000DF2A83E|nr:Hpt domain-containing protein [Notoacmeibacter marinus]